MKQLKTILLAGVLIFLSGSNEMINSSEISQRASQNSFQNKYIDCYKCHNYQINHHPVDFIPIKKILFPLYDGKITCRTCHTDDHKSGSDNFLRGRPYQQPKDFCLKCHKESYKGINPHLMLDENGNIRKLIGGVPVCLLCHLVLPNPEVDRTEDVQFRADVGFLCWRCHKPMANAKFFKQHFLVSPPPEQLKIIEENEKKLDILIPLVPRERITCSTCHNPHQKGVILRESAAKGADSPSRLRIPSPQLCFVCHQLQ
jgi:predicted CXXCH cytochrome family protein